MNFIVVSPSEGKQGFQFYPTVIHPLLY